MESVVVEGVVVMVVLVTMHEHNGKKKEGVERI